MAGIVGERASAEQQEDQNNPHHDRLPQKATLLRGGTWQAKDCVGQIASVEGEEEMTAAQLSFWLT